MRNFWRFGIFLLVATMLAACGQAQIQPTALPLPTLIPSPIPATVATDTAFPTPISQSAVEPTPQAMTSVRFVNAAPDVPTFNIFTGLQAIATNLAFGQYTESTPIGASDYTLKLIPTGSGSSATPLLETTLSIKGDEALLVIISGNGDQISLTALPDKTEALNAGESIIRVIHAISGAGAVVLRNESGDLTSAVNYGEMTLSGILPAGSSALTLNSGDTKLVDYSADLKEQTEYTVILAGHPDSPGVISFNTRTPGRSTVRVINASPQISSVDFYLDDMPLNSEVGFGRPTERQKVTAGEYAVQIYEAGADRSSIEPLASQTITLEAEQNIALIFLGSKAPFTIVSYAEDLSPTPPRQVRVAFMNTLDNLPSIQLEASAGPIPGVSDLVYGVPPSSTLLDAGSYNFHTDAADQNGNLNTVEVVSNLQFEQGLSYLYLITGRMDNNPIILSENVGINQKLEDAVNANGTPEAISAAQVRFVNALQDQHTVDFLLNNAPLLPGLPPQQGSDLIAIDDLTSTIQITIDGGSTPIAELDTILDSNTRYTMVAYGNVPGDVRLLLVPDSGLIFDGQSPHIRLINLSPESDIQLGLATADSSQAPDITLPTDAAGDRPYVPQGVQKSIDSSSGGSASSVVLMPVGTSNVYIFDSTLDEVTAILTSLRLDAGLHYDVFAVQQRGQALSQVFVLTYPVGSG